ncbi:MAG: hypothetical protein ABIP94_01720 [Planctomycetota bacterium]
MKRFAAKAEVIIGLSNTPAPLPLAPFGFPASCTAYTSSELVLTLIASAGVANYSLVLPNTASAHGFKMDMQGASLDPAVLPTVSLPLPTSNGVHVTVGY